MALSFYRVRSGIVTYQFIDGKHDLADVLNKNWAHNGIWTTLNPILFWPGDAMEFFDNDSLQKCDGSFSWSLFCVSVSHVGNYMHGTCNYFMLV